MLRPLCTVVGLVAACRAACPPACPDAGFMPALEAAAPSAGLSVAPLASSAEVLDWHHTRPLTDRHFYKSVVAKQLERYSGGISQAAVTETLGNVRRSQKYQLVPDEGKIYRTADAMFGQRNTGLEYFMQRSLPALRRRKKKNKKKVIEIALNTRDWPQSVDGQRGLPLFTFSKALPSYRDDADIMYPAWAFWEGGPWLSTTPTWQWPAMRERISSAAEIAGEWAARKPEVFFRGSRTTPARDPFVRFGHAPRGDPPPPGAKRWNVRYVKNQSQRSNDHVTNVMKLDFREAVPMEDHCAYRYLLNFDGQAASFRLKTLFLCGSVVLSVAPIWDEFFYAMLIPWVHYVPLAADGSDADATITFLEAHEDWAAQIAENGRQFVLQRLRMEDVQGYWDDLLTEYAVLQDYEPEVDTSLKLVHASTVAPRDEL